MKPKDLERLAEWYYKGENRELVCSEKTQSIFTRNPKTKRLDEALCLDHQLDQLEDKMIEEMMNSGAIDIHVQCDKRDYTYRITVDAIRKSIGSGKTKNEARLNAILSYVKSIKEKK